MPAFRPRCSPVPEITWRRANGVPFPSKVKMKNSNVVLEIPSFQQEDAGGYECLAENKMGKNVARGRLLFHGMDSWVHSFHCNNSALVIWKSQDEKGCSHSTFDEWHIVGFVFRLWQAWRLLCVKQTDATTGPDKLLISTGWPIALCLRTIFTHHHNESVYQFHIVSYSTTAIWNQLFFCRRFVCLDNLSRTVSMTT